MKYLERSPDPQVQGALRLQVELAVMADYRDDSGSSNIPRKKSMANSKVELKCGRDREVLAKATVLHGVHARVWRRDSTDIKIREMTGDSYDNCDHHEIHTTL